MAKKRTKVVPMSDLQRAERLVAGGALIVIPMPLSNLAGAGLIASTIVPRDQWPKFNLNPMSMSEIDKHLDAKYEELVAQAFMDAMASTKGAPKFRYWRSPDLKLKRMYLPTGDFLTVSHSGVSATSRRKATFLESSLQPSQGAAFRVARKKFMRELEDLVAAQSRERVELVGRAQSNPEDASTTARWAFENELRGRPSSVVSADQVFRDPSIAEPFGDRVYHIAPPSGGWFVFGGGSSDQARKLGAKLFRELIPLSKISSSTPWVGQLPLWVGTQDGGLVRIDPPEKKARSARPKNQKLLALDRGTFAEQATTTLRGMKKLSSRFESTDGNGAVVAAAHSAKRDDATMAVYRNKRGRYIVATEASGEHLDSAKNTGSSVVIVTPDLAVTQHSVERGSASNPVAQRMMNPRNY